MNKYNIVGILLMMSINIVLFGQTPVDPERLAGNASENEVIAAENGGEGLPFYLAIAARNNPAVKAAYHAYEAALQKVPQAGAYEDPQLEMGFFLPPMEIIDGRQISQFRLMQMFPWFGVQKAARTEAAHMAKMAFEQFFETRDNLYLEVYTQWWALCLLQQKLINSKENLELLKQLETLALRRFATGKNPSQPASPRRDAGPAAATQQGGASMSGMNMGTEAAAGISPDNSANATGGMANMGGGAAQGMSEVLLIQLEKAELESGIESALSELVSGKARFNTLLNRPADSEITVPDTLAQIPFLLDMESAMQTVTEQNPMLRMFGEEALAYEAKAEMDRKMGYPMFGVGLQYMLIGKSSNPAQPSAPAGDDMQGMNASAATGMNSMNGRDMIMPMASITLPIYRNKYKAAQKESKLLQQAAEEKYADALNRLQAELYRSKYQLDDAVRKIDLYRKQSALIDATRNLMIREFASGKSALADILRIQRQLSDYRLKESEAVAAYNTAAATVRKLIANRSE